jgi:hypothetical protein
MTVLRLSRSFGVSAGSSIGDVQDCPTVDTSPVNKIGNTTDWGDMSVSEATDDDNVMDDNDNLDDNIEEMDLVY